jgi:hypothetical protein
MRILISLHRDAANIKRVAPWGTSPFYMRGCPFWDSLHFQSIFLLKSDKTYKIMLIKKNK